MAQAVFDVLAASRTTGPSTTFAPACHLTSF